MRHIGNEEDSNKKKAVKQFRCKYGNYKIKEDGVKINKPWKSAETVGLMAYLKSDSAIKKLKISNWSIWSMCNCSDGYTEKRLLD